ncbi:hypothetical protein SB48_HM08orf02140 [Heyndrickxia coagulans]|uniref:Uncharacterized protein n=1 Tax=Heyndrickxia coagulans TaxID=1398 RepID=A0AAN0WAV2_HEYCO|nr:hypothetical protein SB48_HM08orf02140 [Heyndrickxia coagulans]
MGVSSRQLDLESEPPLHPHPFMVKCKRSALHKDGFLPFWGASLYV